MNINYFGDIISHN